ncbi:MAG: DUF421 domain-containing protein [Ruminococcus sp.]|nr:DUF421 domain-containing protein [Ruminococcus sp.]
MELLQVALTSVGSVITLFLLTKLMGNKQVSQLSMFDYIIGITIGSIAAEFATELENPERALIALAVYAVSAYLVSVITGKSTHMRKIIIGRPLILFDKGKLYRNNLKKARIDISDFLTHCRNQGYFDLSQIRTAVFEYNGSLSILPVEGNRPLEPSDMKLEPVQQELLVNVILDGNINEENLKKTGNNIIWLEKQLKKQGFHNAEEIFLGCVNTVENTLVLYPAAAADKTFDPFE